MQMALFLGSLYRSFSLFPSGHLVLPFSLFCCVAPSYIKQTVSLAALGDIALIFQHWGIGVMQCAAMDTLRENLSLLNWAKLGRASLSDTGIHLFRSFLFSVLYYSLFKTLLLFFPRAQYLPSVLWYVMSAHVTDVMPPGKIPVYVGFQSKWSHVSQQRAACSVLRCCHPHYTVIPLLYRNVIGVKGFCKTQTKTAAPASNSNSCAGVRHSSN